MITNRRAELDGCFLLHQVREQGHETRALDGVRQLALVPGADAGAFARDDLAEGRQVALQHIRVLIVDGFDVLLAEGTLGAHHFRFGHSG